MWFIESHYNEEITLEDIADASAVSRYHLSRAFAVVHGVSIMRYVRGRRLERAAESLASGAPDILAVAIEAGYGSHEAFTRAFRDHFGVTPEALRAKRNLDGITLQETIRMNQGQLIDLAPPRMEKGATLLIAGLRERYSMQNMGKIPEQWMRFVPRIGYVPGQIFNNTAYGVIWNADEAGTFEYLSGVEVSDFSKITADLSTIRIPEHEYAVFSHSGHVSEIQSVFRTIFGKWIPESGYKVAEAPELEKYGPSFNGMTGHGGFEIWIPVVR